MEEQIKPNKKKSKLKIFGIIIISLFIVISIIVVVGYNNYTNEQENKKEQILTNELEKQIEEQTGQDVEVINTAEQPDYTIHNPLTTINPRHSVVNGSNDEVFYYAHDGSSGGIGNLTFTTSGSGYGFFSYLGSLNIPILSAWINSIYAVNINATTINSTNINTINLNSTNINTTSLTVSGNITGPNNESIGYHNNGTCIFIGAINRMNEA